MSILLLLPLSVIRGRTSSSCRQVKWRREHHSEIRWHSEGAPPSLLQEEEKKEVAAVKKEKGRSLLQTMRTEKEKNEGGGDTGEEDVSVGKEEDREVEVKKKVGR